MSASIGLAFASGDDPDATAEALVRDADTAMYQAKDAGRDAVAVFDESMRTRVTERVELEPDLRSRSRWTSSTSCTSRSSACRTGRSSASRRWCAGCTRPTASSRRPSSSRWPKRAA